MCPKPPSPSMVSGPSAPNANQAAEDILSFDQCEEYNQHHYYRGPNNEVDKVWVVDLGCQARNKEMHNWAQETCLFSFQVLVSQIYVRNSRNGVWNDCGTKDFSVEISPDQGSWTMLLEDTLPDARGTALCDIPTTTFNVSPVHLGRYIRFTAKTRYGVCVALHFLDFKLHF